MNEESQMLVLFFLFCEWMENHKSMRNDHTSLTEQVKEEAIYFSRDLILTAQQQNREKK